jgi:tetratricopeptide (TPR) repeat protein
MSSPTHRYILALEIGEEAVRQGKWQQALTCFQTALAGIPREPRVYSGLGDTHLALADRSRALASYKEAARLAGDNPIYTEKVAMLQRELGSPSDAAQSYLATGDILWGRGNHAAAEARWEQALELRGEMATTRERLALACRQRGDTGGALRHYLALADILQREGRCLMSLHICYTALTLAPEDGAVWTATERAWRCVAVRDKRADRAENHVEPDHMLRGAAEFAQWQLTAEIRRSALRIIGEENPARFIHLRQAMLSEGYGHADVAVSFYEKAIAMGLNAPAVFFALGLLYRRIGRREDARAAFSLASRHPFYRRAVTWSGIGKQDMEHE